MLQTIFLMLSLLVLLRTPAQAQVTATSPWFITGGIGSAYYVGDLSNPGEMVDIAPAFSLGFGKALTSRAFCRLELSRFGLAGDDATSGTPWHKRRNLSFRSTNFELTAVGMLHLLQAEGSSRNFGGLNIYMLAGLGFFYMNPKAELDGKTYSLQPLQTEDILYSRIQPTIPYGLGARIGLNPILAIGIELNWRITMTDYIDDVSTVYRDNTQWSDIRRRLSDRSEGMTFKPGERRGNPADNDGYYFLQLRIEYHLDRAYEPH